MFVNLDSWLVLFFLGPLTFSGLLPNQIQCMTGKNNSQDCGNTPLSRPQIDTVVPDLLFFVFCFLLRAEQDGTGPHRSRES